jgi:hypothetical protein
VNITIENHGDQFNVALTSPGKDEPFLTIKGCRVVNGSKGPFVSWWNHVYASEGFAAAVLSAYNKSKAEAPRRQHASAPHDDSDIPF